MPNHAGCKSKTMTISHRLPFEDAPFGPKTGTNREGAVRIQAYIIVMAALPMICADPPGFDRAVFHRPFNAQVLTFFQETLGK